MLRRGTRGVTQQRYQRRRSGPPRLNKQRPRPCSPLAGCNTLCSQNLPPGPLEHAHLSKGFFQNFLHWASQCLTEIPRTSFNLHQLAGENEAICPKTLETCLMEENSFPNFPAAVPKKGLISTSLIVKASVCCGSVY